MKIRIHWSFWLFALVCFLFGLSVEFIMFVLALVVHEIGHLICAHNKGYLTLNLNITPFGGQINGISSELPPHHEFSIAAAGPLANFSMSVFLSAFLWWAPELNWILQSAIVANLIQGAFNLLPVYPLDGGRMLFCVMRNKKHVDTISKTFSIILIPLCFINLSFLITCIFLFISTNWRGNSDIYISKKINEVIKNYNFDLKVRDIIEHEHRKTD